MTTYTPRRYAEWLLERGYHTRAVLEKTRTRFGEDAPPDAELLRLVDTIKSEWLCEWNQRDLTFERAKLERMVDIIATENILAAPRVALRAMHFKAELNGWTKQDMLPTELFARVLQAAASVIRIHVKDQAVLERIEGEFRRLSKPPGKSARALAKVS